MLNPNKLYWLNQDIELIENQIKNLNETDEDYKSRVEKLNHKKKRREEEREKIQRFIDSIEDAEDRVLAEERYIENWKFEKIGEKHFLDRSTVSKRLKRCLEEYIRRGGDT